MNAEFVEPGARVLPLIIEPDPVPGSNAQAEPLVALYQSHRAAIEKALHNHGAILFQGFGVNTPSQFTSFLKSTSLNLLSYFDGNSPRKKIAAGIYTSTEYPAEYFISLHNELSYSHKWPTRIYFCCLTAATRGGETPIADSRVILKTIPPEIVAEFRCKKVKYIRNLHGGAGFGPSWQDTFETSSRTVVTEHCREAAVDFDWKSDGSLSLSSIRPATARHKQTGEEVWFNQADQFHPSTHPHEVYESLMALCHGEEANLPQYACFGDDTPIDTSVLDEIRKTTLSAAATLPWQEGGLLVIDNMLVCHGRMPFAGRRKILVGMS